MKIKYFRFLYEETRSCFIHFGEVRDTRTKEQHTFLYLRGTKGKVHQNETEHTSFLCPEYIDLVVLGKTDEITLTALANILSGTRIGTLVVSGSAKIPENQSVGCIIRLSSQNGAYSDSFRFTAAGWKFYMKCYTENSIVMMHALDRDACGADQEKNCAEVYEDCVMNVKVLDGEKRCSCEKQPDGYACALGCALHQDHDVCKYKNTGEDFLNLTGTLLMTGAEDAKVFDVVKEDIAENLDEIRFFGISGFAENNVVFPSGGQKRYFIGTESEVGDASVGKICRSGLNQLPVILKEGQGICCSGLLKYVE